MHLHLPSSLSTLVLMLLLLLLDGYVGVAVGGVDSYPDPLVESGYETIGEAVGDVVALILMHV